MTKKESLHFNSRRNKARSKLTRSNLPRGPKATLLVIVDHLSSKCNYEVAWPSISRIAEYAGYHYQSVRRHIKALVSLGVIRIIPAGRRQLIQVLEHEYSYSPSLNRTKHRLNLYSICWKHPFWSTGEVSQEDLQEIAKTLDGHVEQDRGDPLQKHLNKIGGDPVVACSPKPDPCVMRVSAAR